MKDISSSIIDPKLSKLNSSNKRSEQRHPFKELDSTKYGINNNNYLSESKLLNF